MQIDLFLLIAIQTETESEMVSHQEIDKTTDNISFNENEIDITTETTSFNETNE